MLMPQNTLIFFLQEYVNILFPFFPKIVSDFSKPGFRSPLALSGRHQYLHTLSNVVSAPCQMEPFC